MQIAERAWTMVAPQTIENCWKHTGIVPEDARGAAKAPLMEQVGWNIIHAFVESEMTLPNAEMVLWTALAGLYRDEDWREALNMVNNTEPDNAKDLPQHIAELWKAKSSQSTSPASSSSVASQATTKAIAAKQLILEKNLDTQLQELKTCRRIFNVPTAQELSDDPEE
jgi:hypothetical protein